MIRRQFAPNIIRDIAMLCKRRMSTNYHANTINQIDSPFTGCSTGRSICSPWDVRFRSGCTQTHTISSTRTRDTLFGTPDTRSHPIIIIKGTNNATRFRSTFATTDAITEYCQKSLSRTSIDILLKSRDHSWTLSMLVHSRCSFTYG